MSTRSLRRGPTRDRRCHVKFFGPRPARSQFLRGTQVQGRVRRSFRRTTNSQFLPRFRWVAILAPRTRIYGKLAEFRVVLPLRGTNFGVFFGALWQQIRPSWRWAYSLSSRFCGGGGRNRTGVHGFAGGSGIALSRLTRYATPHCRKSGPSTASVAVCFRNIFHFAPIECGQALV
jgi:hypothetical protein